MGKRVGYEAQAASYGPDAWYALVVPVSTGGGEALAIRHARAIKAVLLAAKAWNRARESRRMMPDGLSAEYVTRCRLACACQRLAKIEKEVSRG